MPSDYRVIMISECRTLFLTFSIIRYNSNKDLPNVLFSNSESLLDILILDSSAVVIDSGISYKGSSVAFLAATTISRSSSYLMLYSRYYSIFYF